MLVGQDFPNGEGLLVGRFRFLNTAGGLIELAQYDVAARQLI